MPPDTATEAAQQRTTEAEPLQTVAMAQGELFSIEQISGYATLNRRERKFAEGILRGLSRAEAAKEAGAEGSEAGIRMVATRLGRNKKIAAVLDQAFRRAGGNIEATLAQAAQIAVRAAETLADAEARDPKVRAGAFREWLGAASLIASIHGKLTLNIGGEVNHNHVVLTPALNEQLIEARRRVMANPEGVHASRN